MRTLRALLIGLGVSLGALAQTTSHPSNAPGPVDPIPDHVAFRLFFTAVAENASPSPAEVARQDGKLNVIQLPAADKAALVASLARFKTNIANVQNGSKPMPLNDVVQGTLNELIAQMTPEGFRQLHTYVRFQKKYMRVASVSATVAAHSAAANH